MTIDINGDRINSISIDGQNVREVTVGGDVVFELGIPDNPLLHYSAKNLKANGISDNQSISTWPDISGNGFNLNSTEGNFILRDNYLNNNPVIDINKSRFKTNNTPTSNKVTYVFIAERTNSDNSQRMDLMSRDTVNGQSQLVWTEDSTPGKINIYSGSSIRHEIGYPFGPQLFIMEYDSPTGRIYENGQLVESGNINNDSPNSNFFLGVSDSRGSSGNKFEGTVAELLVYNRILTSEEKLNVERYMRTEYGLSQ